MSNSALQFVNGILSVGTSTINAIPTWNGTTAGTLTSTGVTIDGSNNLAGFNTLTSNGYLYPALSGFANKFRNATFDIYQRGASGSISAGSSSYTADGWIVGAAGAAINWSISGPTGWSTGPSTLFYARNIIQIQAAASGVTNAYIKQRIESNLSSVLTNKNVVFQATVQNNTGTAISPTLSARIPTTTDTYTGTTAILTTAPLGTIASGSTAIVAYNFNTSSSYTGLEVELDFGPIANGSNVQVGNFDLRYVPGLSVGTNTNPPIPEVRPVGVEQMDAFRYLHVLPFTLNLVIGWGVSFNGTSAEFYIPLKNRLRASPTITYPSAGSFQCNFIAVTSIANGLDSNSSQDTIQSVVTVASGLTTGGGVQIRGNGAAQIVISAEI